ncbi:MAG: bifunctional 5-dehydro-2-deoxygluconokinase/5-dehydro-2-deoxyphosphogluconate aldolase [Woeseiaceae bacterium]
MSRPLDVICLGRAAVDLYGNQIGGRLEDMQTFEKSLGGSSGNVAAGLGRLGSRSSMLTRVGDEHMGRFVREALQAEGVDVSHVVTDPDRLTGLVVLGISDRNSFPHIFYRENVADLGIEKGDFDRDYIASSRTLAITGTHLSTAQSYDVVQQAVDYAVQSGTRVILDIDYRPVLWGLTSAGAGEERYIASDEVTARYQSIVRNCDLLVGTEEEIQIAGGSSDTLEALRAIRTLCNATIVTKRGPIGCSIFEAEIPASLDEGISVRGVQVKVLNTLGAGDAFLSGFLHAWLNGEDWEACARSGNACGALVVSRHGCTPAMPTKPELEDYLSRAGQIDRPDKDSRINLLHRASTRRSARENLCVLAFDHRRQLEDMLASTVDSSERIAAFKNLVCTAVEKVANKSDSNTNLGIIVDERYGESVLASMSAKQWWIGRPVEIPGSCPVEFDPRSSMGLPLSKWPASHVVKCLVFYHPDDDIELRLQQEDRVRQLHADCVDLDRDLLLELIASSKDQACDAHTIANVQRRFYNLGIYPAWWKLEAQTAAGWQEISDVINAYDPLCNGVLMLGLDAPEAKLRESFAIAAPFDICKGFAVGRSIFGSAARSWFAGEIDDQAAVDMIAENYQQMISFWKDSTAVRQNDAQSATG